MSKWSSSAKKQKEDTSPFLPSGGKRRFLEDHQFHGVKPGTTGITPSTFT
jgi:hypothetical protein